MSTYYHHPLLKSLVIAGYLLATTVSGLFHDHGDQDECCAVGHCQNAAQASRENSAGHCHSGCCHHHHGHRYGPEETKAKSTDRLKPGERGISAAKPIHGPCAVCQFLAHHHAVTPVAQAASAVLPPPVEQQAFAVRHVTLRLLTHAARGPPSAA